MTTDQDVTEPPSTSIAEFLQRHPEVQVGNEAKADLEKIHSAGNTSCLITKLFDNTILHQDYDASSNRRVFALAVVNDIKALARYDQDHKDGDDKCRCKSAVKEGAEHYLHKCMVEIKKPDCKIHEGEDAPNPNCSACWPFWCGSNCQW